ncbi:aldolase [Alphaproteobacteria bacterium KMM 3653]|uniref:Aldolase n=1 Tax=Harenicola maris TaxID=2841044 RepID=A0AAP2CRN3_9RHOB|nr:aldolase [Harenicola maris]
MMKSGLRQRMLAAERLSGTFIRTPGHEVVEVMSKSRLDFICLDAEHAAFDRGRMDAALAVATARGMETLVRVPSGRAEVILGALDSGACGIVVPHVDSAEKAAEVARAARYGPGGRGFAGATRWGGLGGASMAELIEKSAQETVVIAQIEEASGLEACEEIAATPGIDALFIGPSDLSINLGKTDMNSPELRAAYERVGRACRAHGKCFVTWVPNAQMAVQWHRFGVTMFLVGSELTWMLAGANAAVEDIASLPNTGYA